MPRGIPNKKILVNPLPPTPPGGSQSLAILMKDGEDGWRLQAWDFTPHDLVEALRLALIDQVARSEGHAPIDVRFSRTTRVARQHPDVD